MIYLRTSPCPERHVDRGRTESLIASARMRMQYGMPTEEIREDLIKMGCTDEGNLFLIITAASLLEK